MTFENFITLYNGKYIDYDGFWGFQCVDLMRKYVQEVHGFAPYTAIPAGPNAKSIFKNFKDNKYYKKIYNSPTNAPKRGDLVFWGWYPGVTGWKGHVAICSDAWMMSMITFDQNYPTGSFCKYVNHSYKGVLGWLTPKK